ncbi:MAG: InlB B-repeat-containing protein, partial [Clostridia bacterium]|nr:InlB B-repeat-containing protein [Clostridia bacterium]
MRVCKNCKKKQEKEIAALGHDWGEVEATVEATCKKAGKGTVTCLRCGKQKTQKLPALGHDWSEFEVTEPATCTAAGKEVSTCLNCGKEKTREIPATGHDWGKWQVTQEATCEAEGAESRKCTLCDAEETRVVPKTEHNWSKWQVTQEATCDAEGAESRKCTLCGAEETQNIPKTEHSWSEWSVTAEASCSQEGKQTRVCAICGAEETQNVPKTEHSWGEWTVTREATCTAAGEKTRTCGVCGEKQTEVGDPILPHTYVSQVTEPTCDAPGSVVYTCEVCGDTYTEEGEPALGHQWGEWTVTPATETAPEIRTRVCERCGLEEVVEVEAAATDEKTEAEETYTVTWLDGDEKTPLYTETCKVGDPVPESSAYKGSKEPTKVSEECTFAFTGWSAAETDQETGNVTYKPLFDKTVTISFAGWEGAAEKAPDPISAHPAEKLDLSAILPKTLTREGYTFIGYADGDGKAIADLTSFTVPEKHTTITAQWRANIKAIEIEAVESHLYKLSLEEAVKLLPAAGKATLADGTALDLKLTWDAAACVGKDGKKPKDLSVDGVYTFTAQFTDKAGKAIEHTLNEGVAAQCALTVSPIVSGDYEAHLDAKGNAVLTG